MPEGRPGARLELELVPGRHAIVRFAQGDGPPAWVFASPGFAAVLRTPDECSVVVPEGALPPGLEVPVEGGWRALFVRGSLDFGLVGILADLSGCLARAGVPLLALSTFDTDWLFVKEDRLERAVAALEAGGWRVAGVAG